MANAASETLPTFGRERQQSCLFERTFDRHAAFSSFFSRRLSAFGVTCAE
jgi:hypothetical protein